MFHGSPLFLWGARFNFNSMDVTYIITLYIQYLSSCNSYIYEVHDTVYLYLFTYLCNFFISHVFLSVNLTSWELVVDLRTFGWHAKRLCVCVVWPIFLHISCCAKVRRLWHGYHIQTPDKTCMDLPLPLPFTSPPPPPLPQLRSHFLIYNAFHFYRY